MSNKPAELTPEKLNPSSNTILDVNDCFVISLIDCFTDTRLLTSSDSNNLRELQAIIKCSCCFQLIVSTCFSCFQVLMQAFHTRICVYYQTHQSSQWSDVPWGVVRNLQKPNASKWDVCQSRERRGPPFSWHHANTTSSHLRSLVN